MGEWSDNRRNHALPGAAIVVILAAVVAGGCRPPAGGGEPTTEAASRAALVLRGAGATFPAPLYEKWFEAYQRQHPDVAIVYEPVGSGEGVRRFVNVNVVPEQQVDFGASDSAMTDEQMSQVKGGAMLVPVVAGSVALAYNLPGVTGDLKLSRAALAGIFLGEITSWDDPRITASNPGLQLPRLAMVTVVRLDSSGTTFALTKHLDAISPEWRARHGAVTLVNGPGNAIRGKGNEGVAAMIQRSEGALGYVGYEFARQLGLKMALLENRDGQFVAPSPESASAGLADVALPDNLRAFVPDPAGRESYPIVTMTWILVHQQYPDPKKAAALKDLLAWCLRDGQSEAPKLGFVPLPPTVASKGLAALDRVQTQ